MGRPRKKPGEPVSEQTARRQRQRAREGKDATTAAVSWERPSEPSHLTAEQKRVWRQIVRDLEANGILAQSDAAAIEMVATALGTVRECQARIKVVGRWTDEGRKTTELQLRALTTARPYVEQLALSPRGRHNLGMGVSRAQGVKDKPAADPLSSAIGESPRLKALRGGKAS